jgi:hypothetical protein
MKNEKRATQSTNPEIENKNCWCRQSDVLNQINLTTPKLMSNDMISQMDEYW